MTASLVEQSEALLALLEEVPPLRLRGRVADVSGLAVDVVGLCSHLAVGDRVELRARDGVPVPAEIVGFRGGRAQAMAYTAPDGLGPGAEVEAHPGAAGNTLAVSDAWVGRIIDPLGRPLDRRGPLPRGPHALPTRRPPPDATTRARLGPRIDLGVGVLNAFTTCRAGQRLGLFAGSGIGKSVLLAMLARNCACEVAVLALVGERGREVREFIEDDLGAEGLARSVVVVATSDASPLMRRQAAYSAMTIAEHFRDAGKNVLLLMDSVTRFCLGLREIGLSAGQPPATRGYPPGVFAELPRLLERAGAGEERAGGQGSITALFTVLVEGDDHNEPVADEVRGIVDGHVVLDRQIAERGRYPAVDVLRSLSRTMPACNSAEETALIRRARGVLALYAEMADLVRLGAYRAGTDPAVDEAVRLAPRIETVLSQGRDEQVTLRESFDRLRSVLEPAPGA